MPVEHGEDFLRIRYRSQDRLAADDHELVLVCDFAAGASDVRKLLAGHDAALLSALPSMTPFLSPLTWARML